eukprot:COSAG01_NODE_7805_length_3050_cov_1.347001_1_plen_965_part_01
MFQLGAHGSISYLISPTISTSVRSMSFWYHMHGITVGTLSVQALVRGEWVSTGWSVTGQRHVQQSDRWLPGELALPRTKRVRFAGSSDGHSFGDVAIDTVSFSTKLYVAPVYTCTCANGEAAIGSSCTKDKASICASCDPGFTKGKSGIDCVKSDPTCNFDNSDVQLHSGHTPPWLICGWTESGKSVDQTMSSWTRGDRAIVSTTGPSKPHSGKFFMYLKPGRFDNVGDTSYLTSPKLGAGSRSLSFFYSMYGKSTGTLAVEAKVGGQWDNGYWTVKDTNVTVSKNSSCNVTLAATMSMLNFKDCKAAIKGQDSCWDRVNWAMANGIPQNPKLYPGLSTSSSFSDVQCELSQWTATHGKTGGDCYGFTPCNMTSGRCKSVVPPPPLPAARTVKLDGHAHVSRCGLVLDGDGDRAVVDSFDYASDGDYALGFWFSKDKCTSNAWEYMYSHNAHSGSIESSTNPGINIYLACKASYMRAAIVGDKAELIAFDYDVHGAASFSPVTARWVHVVLSVSNTGLTFYVDGNSAFSSKVTVPFTVYWGMLNIISGAGSRTADLSTFTQHYLGSTLKTKLHIGARTDVHKDRHTVGTIANVQVATTSICASAVLSWFRAGHAQLTDLGCVASTWVSTGWREVIAGNWTATGWTVTGQQHTTSLQWSRAELSLPAGTDRLRFVGSKGNGQQGSIAVDTVVVSTSVSAPATKCSCANGVALLGPACKGATSNCASCNDGYAPAGSAPLGQPGSMCAVFSAACAFDTDDAICGWTESGQKHWKRGTWTDTGRTGADQAHSGKFFMFLETSLGHPQDLSYLTSAAVPLAAQSMQFFYHMYGSAIGSLSVEVKVNGTWTGSGWYRQGQQHRASTDKWTAAFLTLPAWTTQVRFVGTRGYGVTGDISLDSVTFTFNSCPAPLVPVSTACIVPPTCTCDNGTAAVGLPQCLRDKEQACVSCDEHFGVPNAPAVRPAAAAA